MSQDKPVLDEGWGMGAEGDKDVLAFINETPMLLSLLYDLDLLPEQHPDHESPAWDKIFTITNHWRESALERQGSGWISVEERLPEKGVDVLIYHVLGDRDRKEVPHACDVAFLSATGWFFPWDRDDRQRPEFVTHWMPPPLAPHASAQTGEKINEPPQDQAIRKLGSGAEDAGAAPDHGLVTSPKSFPPASGSPDEGSIAQSGLERSPVTAEVAGSNPAGAATIEELIGRLEGAYSTVFERSLAKEAALALRGLVQERSDYRMALWKVYEILGFDTDGDKTPDALKYPPLTQLLIEAEEESRADYDNACSEATALQSSLTQHKDWLREALEMLDVCRGNCDLYFSAYGSLTFDVEDQRQIAEFVDEFVVKIRKLMEGE